MEPTIDALETSRHRMLIGFLVAYVAWQVPTIAESFLRSEVSNTLSYGLTGLAAVAGVVWMAYGVRLATLLRAIRRSPGTAAALDDERIRQLRLRAFGVGFWSVGGFLVAARLVTFLQPLDGQLVAQAGILIAVVGAIGSFLYFDRE